MQRTQNCVQDTNRNNRSSISNAQYLQLCEQAGNSRVVLGLRFPELRFHIFQSAFDVLTLLHQSEILHLQVSEYFQQLFERPAKGQLTGDWVSLLRVLS